MEQTFSLNQLTVGSEATVHDLLPDANIKRRLLDLGFTPGAVVKSVLKSPGHDPVAYMVRGAVIALRSEDASTVLCSRRGV